MIRAFISGFLCIMLFSFLTAAEQSGVENLPTPPTFLPAGAIKRSPSNIPPYKADSVIVLVYRINFSDKDCPYSESELNLIHDTTNQMYYEWSGEKFRALFTIHPQPFNAPNTADYYYQNWGEYVDFCESNINNTGVNFDDPGITTRILTLAPEFGFNSSAAPPWVSIAGGYEPWVIIHEMGHALGLLHANGLDAVDQVIGVEDYEKENMEYGNVYGNMGIGYNLDYGPIYKDYFGWFESGEVKKLTNTGIYKLYPHDQTVRVHTPIAMTIPSGNNKYTYWLEYRPEDEETREGVLFHIAGYLNNSPGHPRFDARFWDTVSYLLDMTPNSVPNPQWWGDDMKDAALTIGNTFEDPFDGFTIKVLGVNDGVWDENGWIELEVYIPNTYAVTPEPDKMPFKLFLPELYRNEQYDVSAFNVLGKRVTGIDPYHNKFSEGLYIIKITDKKSGKAIVNKKVLLSR